jgi:HNH endonuclease
MSTKKTVFDLNQARDELTGIINNFISLAGSDELRSRVKALVPAFHLLRKFGTNIIPGDTSARERILIYFQKYPLTVIASDELMVVAGITDYQRRIRELRVQFGWPILGGSTAISMIGEGDLDVQIPGISAINPDEYIMLDRGQDRDAALRWNLINSLRKEQLPIKEKLTRYFRDNVGKEITGEELSYLAKDAKEWARRVRELRTEEGWPIVTRNTGRADLPVGVYVLEEDRQAEVHDRKIDDSTRVQVLTRDNHSCRKCGWNYTQKKPGDPRNFLELHHLDYHADKGSNTASNLITVCNVDHDYIHKKHLDRTAVLNWMGVNNL